MKTLLMSTVAALMFAGTAYAQQDVIVVIDEDVDGVISMDEFGTWRAETGFGAWDTDGDGLLSSDEYAAGIETQDDADTFGTWDDRYSGWDADGDGMLSMDEYNQGVWSSYDADEDGFWSQEESAAWEEDEMRYDATLKGSERNSDDSGSESGGANN